MSESGESELAVGADAFTERGADLEVAVVGAGAVGATALAGCTSGGDGDSTTGKRQRPEAGDGDDKSERRVRE
jgi:spore coat protein CotH